MSPNPATCPWLLMGQCVCRPFQEIPHVSSNWPQAIEPQAAEAVQAPNICLNDAGAHTHERSRAYTICCFFYMIKIC